MRKKVMVFAPHPDDETLGCGGLVRCLRRAGVGVHVVYLTSGDRGVPDSGEPPGAIRETEARRALEVLGAATATTFLRLPDGGIHPEDEQVGAPTQMGVFTRGG